MFRLSTGFALILLMSAAHKALAGGAMDLVIPEHDPADEGVSFFGFVKDTHGAPIAGARVTTEVKDGPVIILQSNATGFFNTGPFSKKVVATDVTVSCEKDGYQPGKAVARSVVNPNWKKPVEMACRLARK